MYSLEEMVGNLIRIGDRPAVSVQKIRLFIKIEGRATKMKNQNMVVLFE
jgi:hypothetical protein